MRYIEVEINHEKKDNISHTYVRDLSQNNKQMTI